VCLTAPRACCTALTRLLRYFASVQGADSVSYFCLNHLRLGIAGGLFCSLSWLPSHSDAASFDCAKAKLPTEQKICAHRALNDSDVRLDMLYHIVLHILAMGNAGEQRDAQSAWLKQRNHCKANVSCIAKVYQQRQQQLQNMLQQRVFRQGPF
jgi:uncharacterized protein